MASSTRPPLARGHTTPIYERRNPATDPPGLRLPSLPEVPDHAYHPRPPGSSSSETTRRVLSADDVIHTTTSRRPSPRLPLPLPTPHPHAHAFPNGIFSPGYDHSSANSSHAPPRAAGSYFPSPMAPSISTPVPATNTNVPHCRVSNTVPYPQHSAVKMEIETSRTEHVLYAPIGPGFSSDCITIAAKKGNKLLIVADRWEAEDCHYEWQVRFDRDADMSDIRALFQGGVLKVTVKRLRSMADRPS